jgi:ankyrin repeat protein
MSLSVEDILPAEDLAKILIKDVKSSNPWIRASALKISAQGNYSEATRRVFSQIALHLLQNDGNLGVQGAALTALGELHRADPAGDPKVKMVGDQLRRYMEEKIPIENAPLALHVLSLIDADAPESRKIALEYIRDKKSPKSLLREAYALLYRAGALPQELSESALAEADEHAALEAKQYSEMEAAIAKHDLASIRRLGKRGVRFSRSQTKTLLVKAIEAGNRSLAMQLIDGAEVDAKDEIALLRASEKGFLDVVKLLLLKGAKDDFALCYASANGHLEVVKLLLEKNADIHASEDCALRDASANGHLEVVKLLLEKGADLHPREDSGFRQAAGNGHLDVVKLLLEKGAEVHARKDFALLEASANGHLEVVKLLLEKHADLHAENDSALREASATGHLNVVKLLLEKGADLHAENDSALREASATGRLDVVRHLLEKGADLHAEAAPVLRPNGRLDRLNRLLEGDDARSLKGSALYRASANGHLDVVNVLLEKGASIKNLLDAAKRTENFELERALEKGVAGLQEYVRERNLERKP